MKEIKVPIDIETKFSHFCEGCEECTPTLERAYGKSILTCDDYRTCSRLWQEFSRRGIVIKRRQNEQTETETD